VSEGERFTVFLCIWVGLGILLAVLVWRGSLEAKRKWFPRMTILAGLLFTGFVYWISPAAEVLYVAVPVVALITFLNLKTTKFCSKCGAYYQDFGAVYRPNYCRKCGQDLSSTSSTL
jgi:hypothetical protein